MSAQPQAEAPQAPKAAPLSLFALTALVIGSMIGGGIFSLPSQMANAAAPGPLLIGWIVTGLGMLALAFTYQRLAVSRPDLDAGVYGYARAAFGDYVGYCSAWGYWMSAWVGNVGYMVLLMASIGVFLPGFGDGNTVLAIACASVLLWVMHFFVLRGIHEAAVVNTIVTVAKIVPLVVFIIIAVISFKAGVFTADFWGKTTEIGGESLGSTLHQMKGMMLVTVWVFIGIEGASVYSERAASRKDVGKATVMGFLAVLALLIFVNFLSYGILSQPELADLKDPSMAGVLDAAVGSWGSKFIAAGLIISLLGALLAWVLMCAEILRVPSKEGVLPKWMGKENKNGVPSGALWLTNACVQALLIWTLFNSSTYTSLIYLASALILVPYLLSALYQLMLAVKGEGKGGSSDLFVGIAATAYTIWLVYAGGLVYLLFSGLVYAVGTVFFVQARKENGVAKPFKTYELVLVVLFVVMGLTAIFGLVTGSIDFNL
ncbi:arginine-ornithine antiporter [Actinomyces vulturis]|uniref:arginine-ornithine antiporter n=1 Tax=Actinomyces vulturis TaxID=1857645 RepID=UPI000830EEA2|nr:arginine-ornithine antiporter [Actinomyces vulturis]